MVDPVSPTDTTTTDDHEAMDVTQVDGGDEELYVVARDEKGKMPNSGEDCQTLEEMLDDLERIGRDVKENKDDEEMSSKATLTARICLQNSKTAAASADRKLRASRHSFSFHLYL